MSSSLYDKQNYSNGIEYYSGYIVEYDLRKANISALLSRGIISTELYTNLLNSDKIDHGYECISQEQIHH